MGALWITLFLIFGLMFLTLGLYLGYKAKVMNQERVYKELAARTDSGLLKWVYSNGFIFMFLLFIMFTMMGISLIVTAFA